MGKVISGGGKYFTEKFKLGKIEGQILAGDKKAGLGPEKSGDPADPKEIALENVTVTGDKQKVGANDAKVLTHLKESGRDAKSVSEAMKKWGSSRVHQSAKHARGADYTLFQGQHGRG